MKSTRTCAYCGDTFHGRIDKRYCSSSCKSRDFREREREGNQTTVVINNVTAPVEEPMVRSLRDPPVSESRPSQGMGQVIPAPHPAAPEKPVWQRLEESYDAAKAKHDRERLHQDYTRAVKAFLDGCGRPFGLAVLQRMSREVGSVIDRYVLLSEVRQGDELHRRRLDDLYDVQDALKEAIAEADHSVFWRPKEAQYFISDKKRRKMRERLIG